MMLTEIDSKVEYLAREHGLDMEATWIADYDMAQLHVLRRSICNTQELKVKYLNTLRQVVSVGKPTNKVGAAIVSDYDLLDATSLQQCEALLRTFGKWEE